MGGGGERQIERDIQRERERQTYRLTDLYDKKG